MNQGLPSNSCSKVLRGRYVNPRTLGLHAEARVFCLNMAKRFFLSLEEDMVPFLAKISQKFNNIL